MIDRHLIREGLSDQTDGHIETDRMIEKQKKIERKAERKREWEYASDF